MDISTSDLVPLSQVHLNFAELAEQVNAGAEKVITKNGESYIALIDAKRLDYYHKLEHERIHLLLLEEANKGMDDIATGRVQDAHEAIKRLKNRQNI